MARSGSVSGLAPGGGGEVGAENDEVGWRAGKGIDRKQKINGSTMGASGKARVINAICSARTRGAVPHQKCWVLKPNLRSFLPAVPRARSQPSRPTEA